MEGPGNPRPGEGHQTLLSFVHMSILNQYVNIYKRDSFRASDTFSMHVKILTDSYLRMWFFEGDFCFIFYFFNHWMIHLGIFKQNLYGKCMLTMGDNHILRKALVSLLCNQLTSQHLSCFGIHNEGNKPHLTFHQHDLSCYSLFVNTMCQRSRMGM